MGYGIMRIEKRGRSAVFGLQIEANRSRADHEAGRDFDKSDVNWDKTDDNVHLIKTDNWNNAITKRIKDEELKTKKDSIVLLDALYTASSDFFKDKSQDEIVKYFNKCLEFHIKTYCQDDRSKVINAVIHFDETTPHMQVASIPIYEDSKGKHLSAKLIMGGRGDYVKRQDNFYEEVTKNYGLERSDTKFDVINQDAAKRKHLSVQDYKIKKNNEELDKLIAEQKELIKQYEVSETKEVKSFFKTKTVRKSDDEIKQTQAINIAKSIIDREDEIVAKSKQLIEHAELIKNQIEDLTVRENNYNAKIKQFNDAQKQFNEKVDKAVKLKLKQAQKEFINATTVNQEYLKAQAEIQNTVINNDNQERRF